MLTYNILSVKQWTINFLYLNGNLHTNSMCVGSSAAFTTPCIPTWWSHLCVCVGGGFQRGALSCYLSFVIAFQRWSTRLQAQELKSRVINIIWIHPLRPPKCQHNQVINLIAHLLRYIVFLSRQNQRFHLWRHVASAAKKITWRSSEKIMWWVKETNTEGFTWVCLMPWTSTKALSLILPDWVPPIHALDQWQVVSAVNRGVHPLVSKTKPNLTKKKINTWTLEGDVMVSIFIYSTYIFISSLFQPSATSKGGSCSVLTSQTSVFVNNSTE